MQICSQIQYKVLTKWRKRKRNHATITEKIFYLVVYNFLSFLLCAIYKFFLRYYLFSFWQLVSLNFQAFFFKCKAEFAYSRKVLNSQNPLNILFRKFHCRWKFLLDSKLNFVVMIAMHVLISTRPDLKSKKLFIILNEHSIIGPVKRVRWGQTKLLNTRYRLVLNTLLNQTSNLSSSQTLVNLNRWHIFVFTCRTHSKNLSRNFRSMALNSTVAHGLRTLT